MEGASLGAPTTETLPETFLRLADESQELIFSDANDTNAKLLCFADQVLRGLLGGNEESLWLANASCVPARSSTGASLPTA